MQDGASEGHGVDDCLLLRAPNKDFVYGENALELRRLIDLLMVILAILVEFASDHLLLLWLLLIDLDLTAIVVLTDIFGFLSAQLQMDIILQEASLRLSHLALYSVVGAAGVVLLVTLLTKLQMRLFDELEHFRWVRHPELADGRQTKR